MGPDDKYRSLIADTLLVRGSDRWVLDAKYKRGFGNEDRNDRFPMCAYAAGFQAERATLVYPTQCGRQSSRRVLLDTTYGNRPLLIEHLLAKLPTVPSDAKRRSCGGCFRAETDTGSSFVPADSRSLPSQFTIRSHD